MMPDAFIDIGDGRVDLEQAAHVPIADRGPAASAPPFMRSLEVLAIASGLIGAVWA